METQIVYASPLGELLEDDEELSEYDGVDSEELISLLLARDESYWQDPYGCGRGGFELVAGNYVVARLTLTRLDSVGYWLSVGQKQDAFEYYLAVNEKQDADAWVSLQLGGEDEEWPAVFFHPLERAIVAVREFCLLRERALTELPQCLNWVSTPIANVNAEDKCFNKAVLSEEYWNYSR